MHVPAQPLEEAGEWDAVGAKLAGAAQALEGAGCAGAIICCNSVHQAYDLAQAAVYFLQLRMGELDSAVRLCASHARCTEYHTMVFCAGWTF